MISKDILLKRIDNMRLLYLTGWCGSGLLRIPQGQDLISKLTMKIGDKEIKFDEVLHYLKDPKGRDSLLTEYGKIFLRTVTRDSFEIIREYCRKTNQIQIFERQPWYIFAKIIRNAMAHDFRFGFTKNDRKQLPITWNGMTITEEMEGSYLFVEVFTWGDAWNILQNYWQFVKNELN